MTAAPHDAFGYGDARGQAELRTVLADYLARLRGVGAVLMIPAHQYPTGVALHPDRRAAALDRARESGGLLLEDDYDGEFRHAGSR